MFWISKAYRHVSATPGSLGLGGIVGRPNFGLRYEDLAALPHEFQVDDVGAYATAARLSGSPIQGVRIAALIELAAVEPETLYVVARTHGGFSVSVWRREIERLAIVAYGRGGAPLSAEMGGPFRLLLPGFQDESRDLYDLATLEFTSKPGPDSRNQRARMPAHSSAPGEVQGGLTRATVDPTDPRTIVAPPP